MGSYQDVFKRYEKKYLLEAAQFQAIRDRFAAYMQVDSFGKSQICNIYFDTPDDLLVRRSIDKPVYKEKLRLRTYGVAQPDSTAFVELKKKFDGVVYKRRVEMPYTAAMDYLCQDAPAPEPCQITREIDWFKHFYTGLRPAMYIGYERVATFGRENPDLRVTFDTNIRWRTDELSLTAGTQGRDLLRPDQVLMEIKIPGAMPLWMAAILGEEHIFSSSFSKYGSGYQDRTAETKTIQTKGGDRCA